ncbi:MAG: nuclear transport factor 2 family protein [Patescibacteria group bacterium]
METNKPSLPMHTNLIPEEVATKIIAADQSGKDKAQVIIDLYQALATKPTPEAIAQYVADDYIQHSPMLPDGPEGLATFFASLTEAYPVSIDVHRVLVVDDWAMAHVNFRNMNTDDENDLGMAGVDIYTFGSDGKITEHWDAVQEVPAQSANPNGMFAKIG